MDQMKTVDAPKSNYDAIVIGSGAGGATLALRLAQSGMNILVVERGDFITPAVNADGSPASEYLYHRQKLEDEFMLVGGKTKYYGAALYRYRESDFRETKHEAGISPAWPVSYADLEPYYTEAETLYRVHGSPEGDPSEPHRSTPYPHAPLPDDPAVAKVAARLKKAGIPVASIPRGIDYGPGGACTLCPNCDVHHCPLEAKMDAETAALRPALQTGNVDLMVRANCQRVLTDAAGKRATGVILERDGEEIEVKSETVAVCAGIPHTALLLRQSRTDAHPEGLGNATGNLGKRVGAHSTGVLFPLITLGNMTARHTKTIAINAWYDGTPDWPHPLGVIQTAGQVPFWEQTKWPKSLAVHEVVKHSLPCFHMTEATPDADTGWQFEGDALGTYTEPRHQAGSYEKMRALAKDAFRKAGYFTVPQSNPPMFWHETGSAVMGDDPALSVTGPTGEVHGIKGLYVADASVLPSAGAVNTGLTIMALALRTGDAITGKL